MPELIEWRPVVECPKYIVSSTGLVRGPLKMLTPYKINSGYYVVDIYSVPYKRKHYLVHRLVAAAFIGPVPQDCEVNHINGVKADNNAVNLEYCTRRQNIAHSFSCGLSPTGDRHRAQRKGRMPKGDNHWSRRQPSLVHKGESHYQAKLDQGAVKIIRSTPYEYGVYSKLARRFGVSGATIRDVIRGITWKELTI